VEAWAACCSATSISEMASQKRPATLDAEPGLHVRAVVRYGEAPELRRAIRVEGGWAEEGPLVDFYGELTPPMPWE
jgi:hypothetical protein